MTQGVFTATLVFAAIAAGAAQTAATKTELEGVWQAESIVSNGQNATPEQVALMRLTFTGDRLRIRGNNRRDETEIEVTVALDVTKTPKHLSFTDPNGNPITAIYELKNPALVICFARGTRPAECPAEPGPQVTRIAFKRVK
jgi:uncharacterized protein (TIGR03067 family)